MDEVAGDDRPKSLGPGTPFVGRDRELADLGDALRSATDGRGGLRLLIGDAGVGKTRLAEEFSHRAARAGALVVWGRCWEFGDAPEFWPWVQVVRGLAREVGADAVVERLGEAAPRFARLAPELPRRATAVPPRPEPEDDRFALFASVSGLLRDVAAGRPLLLVLDDLHAADRSSLLLLGSLAVELPDMRVVVLGTYRETEVEDELRRALAETETAGVVRHHRRDGDPQACSPRLRSRLAPLSRLHAPTSFHSVGG